jgi:lysophospholipase L1-like esterase
MRIAERIADKSVRQLENRSVTMVFLGDSVTHGCFELSQNGPQSIETEYRTARAYHHLLKQMIENVFPACPVNIIDSGVGGDNAGGGLKRLERDVISFRPDLAVICFGLNDVCGGPEKLGEYIGNMRSIFRRLNEEDIEIICMSPNMIGTRLLEEETSPFIRGILESIIKFQNNGTMDMYMAALADLCREENVPFCDCYSQWKKLYSYGADVTMLLANHVNHPNEQMHWLFAGSLFRTIFDM